MAETDSPGLLTAKECRIMRGMAILGILAHNYCHMIAGVVKENEFQWLYGNVQAFWESLLAFGASLPLDLMSFFGHYGVPVFLFLSGYGLEMKYGNGGMSMERWRLVGRHYVKLLKMMLPGLLVSIALVCWCIGLPHRYSPLDIAAMLLLSANILTDPPIVIFPGPYWFFGLMLQLYAVYFLLLHGRRLRWAVLLVAVCIACQLAIPPESGYMMWYKYNCMGNMLPFGAGIVFARRRWPCGVPLPSGRHALPVGLVFMILLAVAGFRGWSWTFSPLLACCSVLCLARACAAVPFLNGVLEWFGLLSAALFVWHPIVRSVVIVQNFDVVAGLALYAAASIGVAWIMSEQGKAGPA